MMRSLNSAVAGLRTHQTKMDVIGNNIANVNTYGFKSSRVTFNDIFYQTMNAASSPVAGQRGGTNPTQIGYGSAVATIDVLNTQAGATSTDRALDVYITGDGFLVTTNARGDLMYTRLGNLGFDAAGNLVDPNGNYVLGWPMTSTDENGNRAPTIPGSGTTREGGSLDTIQVAPDLLEKLTGISISTTGEIIGVMEGGATVSLTSGAAGLGWINDITLPSDTTLTDSISMVVSALPNATGLTEISEVLDGTTVTGVTFGGDLAIEATLGVKVWVANNKLYLQGKYVDDKGVTQTLTVSGDYDSKGNINLTDEYGKSLLVLETDRTSSGIVSLATSGPGAGANSETNGHPVTCTQMVQLTGIDKGGNKVTSGVPVAFATASYPISTESGNFSIDLDASVSRAFAGQVAKVGSEDSTLYTLGAIVLAKFNNAAGMTEIGNSQFMASANSGDPLFVRPGLEGTGTLLANYLELSNVDISKEFTEMITTQRGFQANTRIITVSDEMLAELVNLKR